MITWRIEKRHLVDLGRNKMELTKGQMDYMLKWWTDIDFRLKQRRKQNRPMAHEKHVLEHLEFGECPT